MSTHNTEHNPATGAAKKRVARAAGIIGLGTLASRFLGFVRDVLIARHFGTGLAAQAFVVAFKLPNLFRDMLGEGAANSVFIPVLSEYARLGRSAAGSRSGQADRRREEFWKTANIVLSLSIVALSCVVLLGVLYSGILVRMIAPGFSASPEKFNLTVSLTRTLFPYLLLAGMAAYTMGILNTLGHFGVPAFAPCLLNVAVIISLVIARGNLNALALGVLCGGVLQLGVQIPVLLRKGFRFRFTFDPGHPVSTRISRLMGPRIVSSSLYQLNNFIDTIFGSFAWIVGQGGVAVLYFAYRLIFFPLGVMSTALSQAILPTFSEQALDDDSGRLRDTLSWAMRLTFFLLVPASVCFMALALPIITTLFSGGSFDAESAQVTAVTLSMYAIGLPLYGANRILQSCFFALKDTRTPAKIAAVGLISNITLNTLFMFPLKVSGIALATSVSGLVSFALLFGVLRRRIGGCKGKQIASSLARVALAGCGMAGAFLFLARFWPQSGHQLYRGALLAAVILAGSGLYLALCFALNLPELKEAARLLRKKR